MPKQRSRAMTPPSAAATRVGVTVIVTTGHKGVFFGEVVDSHDKTITLRNARMCIYWSTAMRGVLGLAATGPDNSCRISPEVPTIILHDVTAVSATTPEAAQQWRSAPWGL